MRKLRKEISNKNAVEFYASEGGGNSGCVNGWCTNKKTSDTGCVDMVC